MDITTYLQDSILSLPIFVFSTIFFLILVTKQAKSLSSKNIKNLPPGPPQLPIIGNLHQAGDRPHVTTAKFAQEYGPLISLRLGQQILVIASSPEAAMEILKTNDHLLSSRFVPTALQQPDLAPHSLIFQDCNQTWKSLRTLSRTEMFSAKALESQSKIREEKVGKLVDFLRKTQGQSINMEHVVFTTLFNTLTSVIFGKELIDLKDDYGTGNRLKESVYKIIERGGHLKDFGSFFPVLDRFDLQGLKRNTLKEYGITFPHWEYLIEERRALVNSATWSSDQAQYFVDRLLEKEFSNNQIHQVITELFVAGSNTTTTSIVWTMAELMRNKEVLSKLEEESKREINSDKVTASELSKLPYLNACIKESLRLHPPVPFLLPHRAADTCEVMNYTIPKNAKILVNLWAMGRDPKIWDDPLSFRPERFLGSKVDFKGQHFELLPFGSGRRMCPGMPSGIKALELVIATLIREFDWVMPNGEDPSNIDMIDKFGIAVKMKDPLKLTFREKPKI